MKIGAVCHPRVSLIFTHIFGWTLGAKVRDSALSLGEGVASVASRVRGYLVMLARLIPPRHARDPSPGPRRLVKARAAVHPLPSGEGKDLIPSVCLLPAAFCLLPTAYCLRPTAYFMRPALCGGMSR